MKKKLIDALFFVLGLGIIWGIIVFAGFLLRIGGYA